MNFKTPAQRVLEPVAAILGVLLGTLFVGALMIGLVLLNIGIRVAIAGILGYIAYITLMYFGSVYAIEIAVIIGAVGFFCTFLGPATSKSK